MDPRAYKMAANLSDPALVLERFRLGMHMDLDNKKT